MKRTFFLLMLLQGGVLLADSGEVVLYEEKERIGAGHRKGQPVHVVSYDNDDVSITYDSEMPNVTVVVLDEDIWPIYGNAMLLSSIPSTFTVPNIYKEKYMIQFYTEEAHLYGYFYLCERMRIHT